MGFFKLTKRTRKIFFILVLWVLLSVIIHDHFFTEVSFGPLNYIFPFLFLPIFVVYLVILAFDEFVFSGLVYFVNPTFIGWVIGTIVVVAILYLFLCTASFLSRRKLNYE